MRRERQARMSAENPDASPRLPAGAGDLEWLRSFLADIREPAFCASGEGFYIAGNEAVSSILGEAAAALSGKRVTGLFPGGEFSAGGERWRALAEGRSVHLAARLRAGAREITAEVWASPLHLPGVHGSAVVFVFDEATSIAERRQRRAHSLDRYRSLFENAPIAIWEEDWSTAKLILDRLRASEGESLREYLREHPGALDLLHWAIDIGDVSEGAVALYKAPSKTALVGLYDAGFRGPAERERLLEVLCAFAAGESRCVIELWDRTYDGEDLFLRDTIHISAEHRHDWSRVLRCTEDATERALAEGSLRESEARFRAIIDNSPAAIALKDVQGRYVMVNRYLQELYGKRSEEICGRTASELFDEDFAAEMGAYDRQVLEARQPIEFEYQVATDDGRQTRLSVKFPVLDAAGEIYGVGEISTEITKRKQIEEALLKSEQRHLDLYDNAPDMYFTVARDGTVVSLNAFGASYLGYCKEELIGGPVWQVVHPDDLERVQQQVRDIFGLDTEESELEFRKLRKDGEVLWVHERIRLVRNGPLDEPELRIVCRDVTEAHRLAEQLSYQATHDALTGLVNRREFEARLGRVIETTAGTDSEHALGYLDLDQFKVINDTSGHVAGDELLRQLASVFQRHIRKRDTLARLGGDEFGVLMEHCSLGQATRAAEALRAAVEEFSFGWEDKSFGLGVSIGLVPISGDSANVSSVLRTADTACYAAKDEGRNRVHVYRSDDSEVARRFGEMQWVARLNKAMEEQRLTLYWQRIFPVADSGPVQAELAFQPERRRHAVERSAGERYELLLRMFDESGKLVLPGAYLPAAERYNLAAKLDRWVIRTAFQWLEEHPGFLDRLSMCSVNLSGHSLADEDFLTFVTALFDATEIPPEKFCFEVTETAAIANLSGAIRAIRVLKEWGCHFALDDFGSGLSSFAYLKNLDVDFLKIDGMFVKDIVEDPIDLAMVRSINDIGHVMGKKTIAESVENEAVLRAVAEIGVDFVQGFQLGRPKPMGQ